MAEVFEQGSQTLIVQGCKSFSQSVRQGLDSYLLDSAWETYMAVLIREFASLPRSQQGGFVSLLHAAQLPAPRPGRPVAYPQAQQWLASLDALFASIGLLAEADWRLQPQKSSACSLQSLCPCFRTAQ